MACNLVQCIPMLSRSGLQLTTALSLLSTQVQLDDADWDGSPTCYLEVVGWNPDASAALDVILTYWTGSAWSDVDATNAKVTMPISGTQATRMRSTTSFSLRSGNTKYSLRTSAVTSAATIDEIRLVIVQTNATKTVFCVPLANRTSTGRAATDAVTLNCSIDAIYNGSVTTFSMQDSDTQSIFHWDASKYGDSIDEVSFQIVHGCMSASYAGNYRIYNNTDGAAVYTGTAITSTSQVFEEVTLSGLSNWHDGDNYIFQHSSAGGTTSRRHVLQQANLFIKVSSLTKGEVYWRISKYVSATASAVQTVTSRMKLDHSLYSNPVLYLEAIAWCADNAEVFFLCTDSTDDSGVASWVDVQGWNANSGTKALYRSSSISLPTDGHRVVWRNTANTNTANTNMAFAVVAFTTASSGTNMQMNIGDAWKTVSGMQVNIGDAWKPVTHAQINIGDAWKTIF